MLNRNHYKRVDDHISVSLVDQYSDRFVALYENELIICDEEKIEVQ